MDKKYIVKNCPCIDTTDAHSIFNYECLNRGYKEQWRCYDKDCLIKQVIEKCNKCIDENYPDYYDEGFEEDIVTEFANNILQLFEIEEIE